MSPSASRTAKGLFMGPLRVLEKEWAYLYDMSGLPGRQRTALIGLSRHAQIIIMIWRIPQT